MEIERIALESDTSGQAFSLRVLRFRGSGNGPAVYMQAALHAHEMPGLVALDRLIPRLEIAEKDTRLGGNVTLVPHANPVGLAQAVFGETLGRFDLNGRANFNRSFPSDSTDRLTGRPAAERLKAALLELAVGADVVLDLHCDDEGPVYLYVLERQLDKGLRLARAMQAAVILTDSGDDPISFDLAVSARWAAERRAIDSRFAATIELRGMMDVTPALADRDADGLYRYLVDIGAVDDELPAVIPEAPVIGDVNAAQLIATPVPGAILYDVGIGDWVTEGQRLAVVLSDAGTTRHEIRAPFEGLVMTRRDRRLARRGEEIIKVLRQPPP
jgi:predicted deacylase